MKRLRLAPHIAWPLFVVGLLSMSVATVAVTVVASRSDGGAQVIENYYEKAVNWDETAALQAASDALGWEVRVTLTPPNAATRLVEITLQDRDGRPVEHVQGTVRALRPHRAGAVAERPLAATETPGLYRQAFPISQTGLWDFEITARRDTVRFHTIIRKEITP